MPAACTTRLLPALARVAASLQPAPAPEPVRVGGTWVGTWWMGKYEAPIELEPVRTGGTISGRVAMLGSPGAGEATTVTLAGPLNGDRLALAWRVGSGASRPR
jgi:hypothetical protein